VGDLSEIVPFQRPRAHYITLPQASVTKAERPGDRKKIHSEFFCSFLRGKVESPLTEVTRSYVKFTTLLALPKKPGKENEGFFKTSLLYPSHTNFYLLEKRAFSLLHSLHDSLRTHMDSIEKEVIM